MKELGVMMTTCEVELESLTQLALQMYIIFKRADRFPTLLQWLQIGSSFVTTSKGKAEEFLTFIHGEDDNISFLAKLKNLGKFVFISNIKQKFDTFYRTS